MSAHRRRRTRLLVAAIALVLAGSLASLVGHGLIASAIAYAPNQYGVADEAETPSRAERAELGRYASIAVRVGPPDATLSAWVIEPAQAPRGTILLLHGIRADKRMMIGPGRAFADAGYRAVLVDLRGHGRSGGEYLTYGVVESHDMSQLLDAVARRRPLGPVGVYGYSYGAAVAIQLGARDPRIRAVVAISAFSTLRGVVRDYEKRLLPGVSDMLPDSYLQGAVDEAGEMASFDPDLASPLQAVRRMKAPLLLVHGTADKRVPFRHAVALAQAAGSRTRLIPVSGATHGSIVADPNGRLRHTTLAWFKRWLVEKPARVSP